MSAPHPAVRVQLKKLHPLAEVPRRMSAGAAGVDLVARYDGDTVVLKPLGRAIVGTGIAIAIPDGFEGQVRPRSGWAAKTGVTVVNAPGTIDSDYRGELKVALVNLGSEPCAVPSGERIAQLVIAPVISAAFEEVGDLTETARGEGGFGSTGR